MALGQVNTPGAAGVDATIARQVAQQAKEQADAALNALQRHRLSLSHNHSRRLNRKHLHALQAKLLKLLRADVLLLLWQIL